MFTLMIKTHNKTGLKYLCKTIKEDYLSYKGSGKYWKLHLNKHGRDVSTEVLFQTENQTLFTEKCLYYSNLYEVSKSNKWANLKLENGLDGGDTYNSLTSEEKTKYSLKLSNTHKGRKKSKEECQNISISRKKFEADPIKSLKRKKLIQAVYNTGKHDHLFERYSKERLGSNNPNSKKIVIDDIKYESIIDAVNKLKLTRSIVTNRLKSSSDRWKKWKYLNEN